MRTKTKIVTAIVAVAAIAAVGAGGYYLGQSKAPAGGEATTAAHPPGVPAPREFDHFRVGNRNVKALLADDGIMWVGSSGGVIRYDTKEDSHVIYDNKSGLLSNGVFHLRKEGDDLWVGTYGGGLSILNTKTGAWREYNVPHGMGDAFVYDTMRVANGDVWIATWSGANRIKGGNIDDPDAWELHTVANTNNGLPNDWVYGLAEGKNGEIWMATEGGLARFKDGQWTHWKHADGLGAKYEAVKDQIDLQNDPGQASRHHAQQKKEMGLENVSIAYNPNYVIALAVDNAGVVWTGTWGAGMSSFDGKTWKTYTMSDGLPSNHVFMIRKGPDGKLWVGTNRGLSRFDGKTFANYSTKDGLLSDQVFSLAFEKNGTQWVGSFGGLARFRKAL